MTEPVGRQSLRNLDASHDLAGSGQRGYAGRPVDSHANEALAYFRDLSEMQADADLRGEAAIGTVATEALLNIDSAAEGVRRVLEHDEETITHMVFLVPSVFLE